MRSLLAAVLLLVAMLTLGIEARAQEEPKLEAQALKEQGDAAMLDLEYEKALELYEQSYALDPSPALLYNQGRAHQARGSYPQALAMLERFQREAPPELLEKVPGLGDRIADVRSKTSRLTLQVNVDGATIVVRNEELGVTPLAGPVTLNAGKATILVSKAGFRRAKRTVELPGGGELKVSLELQRLKGTGVLGVRAVAGAEVFIDGKAYGQVPVDADLKPGEHAVIVRHEEYEEAKSTVAVEAAVTRTHRVELVPLPALYERWWLWTGAGALSAATVVVIVLALTEGPVDEGNIDPGVVSAPMSAPLVPVARF